MIKPIFRLEDVIFGCVNNDKKQKEFLYKSFYGYLMGVAIRYTNNEFSAEEIVNDSFVKIYKALPGFAIPPEKEILPKLFKAWIGKITSRTAIDFLRVEKRRIDLKDLSENVFFEEPVTVLDRIHAHEILDLLNQLSDLQRIVFNMVEIEGYKHEEIGVILKITTSHSRVLLARAKSNLRQLYQNNLNLLKYGK